MPSILLLILVCVDWTFAADSVTRDFSGWFDGREGCIVLYDSERDGYIRYNAQGCTERFSPCSTFKIPHTVLALQTGIASNADFTLKWDGVKRGIPAWNHDHTLRTAFQNSAVWFYQELARRIGAEREAGFVRKLRYGNMDITGGTTNFWLQSSLLISADEQIAFLRRLWADELPASRDAQRVTREMMELSRSDGRVLYGKTGTGGSLEAGVARLGWFVGCVSRGERNVFFATRITGERDASGKEARRITESVLQKLGI